MILELFFFLLIFQNFGFVRIAAWPESGSVAPGAVRKVDIVVSIFARGDLRNPITCAIKNGPTLSVLVRWLSFPLDVIAQVQASISSPVFKIDAPDINFGTLKLNDRQTQSIRWRNFSEVFFFFFICVVISCSYLNLGLRVLLHTKENCFRTIRSRLSLLPAMFVTLFFP